MSQFNQLWQRTEYIKRVAAATELASSPRHWGDRQRVYSLHPALEATWVQPVTIEAITGATKSSTSKWLRPRDTRPSKVDGLQTTPTPGTVAGLTQHCSLKPAQLQKLRSRTELNDWLNLSRHRRRKWRSRRDVERNGDTTVVPKSIRC